MKTDDELCDLCLPYAVEKGLFGSAGTEPSPEQKNLFTASMPLIRERLTFIHEVAEKVAYLFNEPELPETSEFIPKKSDINETIKLLNLAKGFIPALAAAPDDAAAEEIIKEQAEKNNVKLGDIMMPLRVTLTGSRVSPPLFGSIRLLGAEKSMQRVERVLQFLEK
jgi:glutamyl-tRNA synthetase